MAFLRVEGVPLARREGLAPQRAVARRRPERAGPGLHVSFVLRRAWRAAHWPRANGLRPVPPGPTRPVASPIQAPPHAAATPAARLHRHLCGPRGFWIRATADWCCSRCSIASTPLLCPSPPSAPEPASRIVPSEAPARGASSCRCALCGLRRDTSPEACGSMNPLLYSSRMPRGLPLPEEARLLAPSGGVPPVPPRASSAG